MKELTKEEKAKAYDGLIERLKDLKFACRFSPLSDTIEEIFPELKESESEDEKIRKELTVFLKMASGGFLDTTIQCKIFGKWLAWLEKKQGENNMGISEATKKKLEDNLNKALEKETPESWNKFLDEQGEQKPIESMPEFKEGDILYNKDSYASDSIFIFKGMSDKTNAYLCYARLYDKKDFSVYSKEDWDEGVGIYGGEFYPANHKQKELLFSEIEKAGYKWNPDKKKMEKIEQNPAWSEEDEEIHRKCICAMRASACGFPEEEKFVEQVDNWLKSLKDRYAWKPSEEQILAIETAINVIGKGTLNGKQLVELQEQLKKLKG